jgi:collagen type III alpha
MYHTLIIQSLSGAVQGGATRFDMLDLAVQPEAGKALLFFPAFADGTADARQLLIDPACLLAMLCWQCLHAGVQGGAHSSDVLLLLGWQLEPCRGGSCDPVACLHGCCRTLHTAEDAVDTKWVTQQWVARGLASTVADPIAAALAGALPTGSGVPPAQQQQRLAAASEEPAVAEALLAAKRGKGKGKAKKLGGSKAGGKGFGA